MSLESLEKSSKLPLTISWKLSLKDVAKDVKKLAVPMFSGEKNQARRIVLKICMILNILKLSSVLANDLLNVLVP